MSAIFVDLTDIMTALTYVFYRFFNFFQPKSYKFVENLHL